jgi:hypothetical protein
MNTPAVPLKTLIEIETLLKQLADALPISSVYEGSLSQRAARASGALSYYTEEAMRGLTVQVQTPEEATS